MAVISDIHGNLQALEAVLTSIDDEHVDKVFCLGDIVGYGARPNECINLICTRQIPCILGNHDEAALGTGDIENFNLFAREAIIWTTSVLDSDSKAVLSGLKMTMSVNNILFVHSEPCQPKAWHYLISQADALRAFESFNQHICFIGHSHNPLMFKEPGSKRRIINVGSVGQPRDHDPRACWGLYDSNEDDFKWIRVEYPVRVTGKQIIEAGLPGFLADRLISGR
ncbi:metallophosphatase family protein [bacterium]|nr:metallophosphatase family protein [bacterium]